MNALVEVRAKVDGRLLGYLPWAGDPAALPDYVRFALPTQHQLPLRPSSPATPSLSTFRTVSVPVALFVTRGYAFTCFCVSPEQLRDVREIPGWREA